MFNYFGQQPSLFDRVVRLINDWQPNWRRRTENAHRDDLKDYLMNTLEEKYTVRCDDGRGLADIAVDNKIAIELKLNLNTKAEINRLDGQIGDFLEEYKSLIVVLLGNTKPEIVRQVKRNVTRRLREYEEPDPFFGLARVHTTKQVEVIVKSPYEIQKPSNDKNLPDWEFNFKLPFY
jgi:hypothetical protein